MQASLLGRTLPTVRSAYPSVSPLRSNNFRWYRNLYLLSIAYDHQVLGLGPDLPWADEPSPGNLRFSMLRILTSVSLLMPAFSLLYSPLLFSVQLLSVYDAPLLMISHPIASAVGFSPGHFRRRTTRLVSYYALFK